ncbi:unnamed protein product [Caretta caretta]
MACCPPYMFSPSVIISRLKSIELLEIKKKQRDSGTSPVEKQDLKNYQKALEFEDAILESEPVLFSSNSKWPSWDTLRTLIIPGSVPYFDDVLIMGSIEDELAKQLQEVLCRFEKSGIQVKKEKCEIGVTSVTFLGLHINAYGIHPIQNKLCAIHDALTQNPNMNFKCFLGWSTSTKVFFQKGQQSLNFFVFQLVP